LACKFWGVGGIFAAHVLKTPRIGRGMGAFLIGLESDLGSLVGTGAGEFLSPV
jgi:hypothetical protein